MTEFLVDRLPPNNTEAEQALLGCCMIDKTCIEKLDTLAPDDFYKISHQKIFEAMKFLEKKETPIDIQTLTARLKATRSFGKIGNDIVRIGGASYLASLANTVPTASNAKHYAKLIAECSLRRKLIDKTHQIQMSAYDEKLDIESVLSSADSEITKVLENNNEKLGDEKPLTMSEMACIFQEDYVNKEETGLKVGITALDNELNGLGGGELIGLTGESGAGKTALALGMALNLAQSGKKVLFFNLEMSSKDVVSRLISIYTGLDNTQLRRKTMDDNTVFVALDKLCKMNLKILSPSWITSAGVARISKMEMKNNGVDFIIVDYINELKDEGREEKDVIESALRNLKPLAMKLNVPILVPFQMNYSGLNKETPSQQDGRSSSKLANVYGVMLSLKMPKISELTLQQGEQQVDLWITKNRHGRSKIKIPLKFQGSSLRFKD